MNLAAGKFNVLFLGMSSYLKPIELLGFSEYHSCHLKALLSDREWYLS
jgi:hypothetical protein